MASLASLASAFPGGVFAAGASEKIRVGVIGCGGRGTDAALNCAEASPDVVIAALGDVFPDQLQWSLGQLKQKLTPARLTATPETCFSGFDAYQKVLAAGVDMVILASPPFFRPAHLKAAIEAGKHVFTEKPVAVDPVGVRSVIATSELAATKGLGIVAGTQRRHQAHYVEIMKRVRAGDIGELVAGQCYWNMGALWLDRAAQNWANRTAKGWSDMEWQVRNWLFTGWASGDHIVEQHVHNLDVMNWAFGAHPVKCTGMGGRAARTDPMFGNIYDHFAVEYEYPNGARVLSMCRQTAGAAENVSERVVGTAGFSFTDSADGYIKGAEALGEPAGLAEPLRRRARRPRREHQGGQAPERGTAGRGELPDRHHGPDERLHGARAELGLGHELLEARPHPAAHGLRSAAAARGRHPGQDAARLRRRDPERRARADDPRPAGYRQAAGSDFSKYGR